MGDRSQLKLYINGRFLTQKQTGVQRFAFEVLCQLDRLLSDPEHAALRGQVSLVTPADVESPIRLLNIHCIAGGSFAGGYAWEQTDLVRLTADGVLLNLCNLAPLIKRRQVVVVHDAMTRAMPHAFSTWFRSIYGLLIPAIIRRASQLATVSSFSRDEISRYFGISASRLLVCYEGGEHILSAPREPSILGRHGLRPKGYFLAVGMGPANKNQGFLLDAFQRASLRDIPMVLTGRRNPKVHGEAALEIPPEVVHVGHVPDGELRALYENALALVYPSSYEGFGLPPLEAMACGCPVIISNQPALLEVAGDAALIVAMGDTAGFTQALRRIADEPQLRAGLSERGLIRAQMFTWRATTERLLAQCHAAAA